MPEVDDHVYPMILFLLIYVVPWCLRKDSGVDFSLSSSWSVVFILLIWPTTKARSSSLLLNQVVKFVSSQPDVTEPTNSALIFGALDCLASQSSGGVPRWTEDRTSTPPSGREIKGITLSSNEELLSRVSWRDRVQECCYNYACPSLC